MGALTKINNTIRITGKRGQSILEYAILLILIMIGIIIMGRYVTRSWNANMQGWEDSAMDSMTEPITRVPNVWPTP